jgi:hypothetical protein
VCGAWFHGKKISIRGSTVSCLAAKTQKIKDTAHFYRQTTTRHNNANTWTLASPKRLLLTWPFPKYFCFSLLPTLTHQQQGRKNTRDSADTEMIKHYIKKADEKKPIPPEIRAAMAAAGH